MLTVSNEAKEYILTKKKSVYLLHHGSSRSCCGNVDFGPSVHLGNPPDNKEYTVKEINGVTVHLPKEFYTHFPITIEVGSFLGVKTLHIGGWKLM